ncbi:MAG: AAA family ATPase [Clostridia bacterium]|nr:AAA family ATPase [Clostridia bacterium]
MKILNLKINQFGKLKNEEINLKDHINIVYGKNESGKSTLLKFILAMFYGLSKNKNGKIYTDYEKYTPWQEEDFSGKIKYKLEDGTSYEVFREFKKKSPKIYNEDLEEISKNFTIDKTSGNKFFVEQTGVEENLFTSTIVSMQSQVKLEEKEQTSLLQKLSNLVSTGEDNVSYQKIMNKLNKRQLEEIGTSRSQDRPVNVISKRLKEIEQEKEYLSEYSLKKYDIEETKQKLENEIKEQQINLEILTQKKQVQDEYELKQEKIKIADNTIREYNKKIDELKNTKQVENKKENKDKTIIPMIGLSILMVLSLLLAFIMKNDVISAIAIVVIILSMIYIGYTQYKKKIGDYNQQTNENVDNEKIKNQVEIMLATTEKLEKENAEQKEKIEKQYKEEIEKIRNAYIGIAPIKVIDELLTKENTKVQIEAAQNKIGENKLKIQSIGLDRSNIIPKLENLASLEEEQASLQEEYERLMFQNEAIELAKQELEKAYYQMKKRVTPKFTNDLSSIMNHISDGKYTNVKLDEKDGLIVEIQNGDYIPIDYLSIGTIDQLYLSLRLGAGTQISGENLPIILDEAFAYYDDERLGNILEFLNKEYSNRQIILLTCTEREKNILQEKNIDYNYIEL